MTNAEWCIQHGIKFMNIQPCMRKKEYGGGYYFQDKVTGEKLGQIGAITTTDGRAIDAHGAFKAWLDEEHEPYREPEPILTGDERGYLKVVVRPFMDCVHYIIKSRDSIAFRMENGIIYDMPLSFEYKGMEDGRAYTTEELGI